MVFTMVLPPAYGFVVLSCGVLPTFTNIYMGGPVMKARREMDVQYPNLYATPGVHKRADEFNRVQRGHQNYLELTPHYVALSLLGGIKHPVAVAIGGLLFCFGSVRYQNGYADTKLDVKGARYQKGGSVKWLGVLASLFSSISFAATLIMSGLK